MPGGGGTGVSPAAGSGVVYAFAADSDFVGQVDFNTNGASNVASTIRTYEADRDLIDIIENKWGGTTVSKYDYVNDALARRTKVANTGTAFSTNRFTLWTYNDRSELLTSKRYDCNTSGQCLTDSNTNSPVSGQQFSYAFDNIGNRTEDMGDPDANTTGYTSNNLNQYTATTSPTESFTYDNDGNLTQDTKWDYTWDAENRLIGMTARNPTSGSKKLVFDYDFMNRRWRKRVYDWQTIGIGAPCWSSAASLDRKFIYDGWNVIMELNGLSSNAVAARYTWGLDLSGQNGRPSVSGVHAAGGIGGLLAMNDNSGSKNYIYFYNANGDVGQALDVSDGSTDARYEYYPYGGELVATGTAALVTPFRFSTKYWDAETQNCYYGERYLRPKMGRWTHRDPAGIDGGILLYSFVHNSPVYRFDPYGLWGKSIHKNLTTLLAGFAGICCAKRVGDLAQQPDEDWRNAIPLTIDMYLDPGAHAADYLKEWHFPQGPDGLVRGGSVASRQKLIDARNNCDLTAFGEALHPFEDSWPHQGYPYFGGSSGHSIGAYLDPKTGTWKPLFGWDAAWSHSADDETIFPELARQTANNVYVELMNFKAVCPCACPGGTPTSCAAGLPPSIVESFLEWWIPGNNKIDIKKHYPW